MEVLDGIHGALCCVVEEEPVYRVPSRERCCIVVEHHVASGLGHGEINPGD